MTNKSKQYSEIFSLKNSTAFIVGGQGLVGTEITNAISSYGAKTVVLDINDYQNNSINKINY